MSTQTSTVQQLETAAQHFGAAAVSFFKGLFHIVTILAPVAEVVGVSTGNPEVTAAAKIADVAAVTGEGIILKEEAKATAAKAPTVSDKPSNSVTAS
ncbi:MAG: hypothetical protein KGI54_08265 [Pseudomonadota bacterium]|nr:hypothetical protein [Pseudomonadota bacterium]